MTLEGQSFFLSGLQSAVRNAFLEILRELIFRIEANRNRLPGFPAGGFEDGEMQVRPSSAASVAGEANKIPRLHRITNLNLVATFFEVHVMSKRAVVMANQNVIGLPFELLARPAHAGIIP